MGYYNVSQHIPINIELKDHCDKNKEILSFKNYIENKDIDFSKMIFVMDRAYFSYNLFKLLNDKNIKFIIRVKDNCTKIKKIMTIIIMTMKYVMFHIQHLLLKQKKTKIIKIGK